MTKQEQWVLLFEQMIGRKPSPQECLQGEETGFNLKMIRKIAGRADFWDWLIGAWRTPSAETAYKNATAYSWITFTLYSLLTSLTIFFLLRSITETQRTATNNRLLYSLDKVQDVAASSEPTTFWNKVNSLLNIINFQTYLLILLGSALIILSMMLGGFLARHFIFKETDFTFKRTFIWYNRFFTLNIPIIAVGVLSALAGVYPIACICLGVCCYVSAVPTALTIAQVRSLPKKRVFYNSLSIFTLNFTATFFTFFIWMISLIGFSIICLLLFPIIIHMMSIIF